MVGAGPQLKVVSDVAGHRRLDLAGGRRKRRPGEGVVQPFKVQVQFRVRDGLGHEPPAVRAVPVRGGKPVGEFGPADADPLRVAGEQLAVVAVAGVLGDQRPELGAEVQLAEARPAAPRRRRR